MDFEKEPALLRHLLFSQWCKARWPLQCQLRFMAAMCTSLPKPAVSTAFSPLVVATTCSGSKDAFA